MTQLERDGVHVVVSLRLEEVDCALLGSSNTFGLSIAECTNGAIPSPDIDHWFARDNEFILPADFERRWFAEDDSAVELTPAVHDVPENVAGVSRGTKRRRCGRFAKVNSLLKAAKGVISMNIHPNSNSRQ